MHWDLCSSRASIHIVFTVWRNPDQDCHLGSVHCVSYSSLSTDHRAHHMNCLARVHQVCCLYGTKIQYDLICTVKWASSVCTKGVWKWPLQIFIITFRCIIQRMHSTILHTRSILYWYHGTTQSLCSWSATTWMMLLEHQAFILRTPPVVSPPLVTEPDQVSKHASLIPRPQVWLADKQREGPNWDWFCQLNHDTTGWLFKLTSRSNYAHAVIGYL